MSQIKNHPNWILDLPPGGLWILTEAFPVVLVTGSFNGVLFDCLGTLCDWLVGWKMDCRGVCFGMTGLVGP